MGIKEEFEDIKRVIRTDNTMIKRVIRTDNTMTKRKRTKEQIMIYKTLHRKLKIEQHEPHLKPA